MSAFNNTQQQRRVAPLAAALMSTSTSNTSAPSSVASPNTSSIAIEQQQQQQHVAIAIDYNSSSFVPVFPSIETILPRFNSAAKGQVPWRCSFCGTSAFGHKCSGCFRHRDAAALRVFVGQLSREGADEMALALIHTLCPEISGPIVHVEAHTNPKNNFGKGCCWVYVHSFADIRYIASRLNKRVYVTVSQHTGEVGFRVFHGFETLAAAPIDSTNTPVDPAVEAFEQMTLAACLEEHAHLSADIQELLHHSTVTAEMPLSLRNAHHLPDQVASASAAAASRKQQPPTIAEHQQQQQQQQQQRAPMMAAAHHSQQHSQQQQQQQHATLQQFEQRSYQQSSARLIPPAAMLMQQQQQQQQSVSSAPQQQVQQAQQQPSYMSAKIPSALMPSGFMVMNGSTQAPPMMPAVAPSQQQPSQPQSASNMTLAQYVREMNKASAPAPVTKAIANQSNTTTFDSEGASPASSMNAPVSFLGQHPPAQHVTATFAEQHKLAAPLPTQQQQQQQQQHADGVIIATPHRYYWNPYSGSRVPVAAAH